ncbi:hypothetical protein [Rhizobium wuzhouense]|uniref:Uncharacterized protein n=1 Tax=Rhizobium wuzhouense TaxID=1986026 RepID=A0ABX5NYF1_9HYPH|nr:hypothetical protein [Rhizobium wuzhouense]PYB77669.1 hypothetical protein DMY87_04800 [Rhizobium wuzhouense]
MTDENTNYEFLRMANQGKKRNRPLNDQLTSAMAFLGEMGVTMEVFSGGQVTKQEAAKGLGTRTGSTRHDHGNAADVFFYKDGRRLDWTNAEDLPVYQDIVRKARANGVTGFGAGPGYMQPGSMHIGFGNPGVWGAGGSSSTAPSWLTEAFGSVPQGKPMPSFAEAAAARSNANQALLQGGFDQTGEQYQPRANPPQVPTPSAAPAGTPDNWQPSSWMDRAGPTDSFTTPPGAAGPEPTWGQVGGAAMRSTPTVQVIQYGNNLAMQPDQSWLDNTDMGKFGTKLDGLNPDEREWVIGRAVSDSSAMELRRQLDRSRDDSQIFERSPLAIGAAFATNILDPVSLLAGGVVGKGVVMTSNALRATTAASRVTRMAEAGIIGLSDAAIASGIQAQVDPNFGVDDFAINALTGVAIGAGIGSIVRGAEVSDDLAEASAAFGNKARNMLADKAEGMGYKLGPQAEAFLRPKDSSVGAMRNPTPNADVRRGLERAADKLLPGFLSSDVLLRTKAGSGVADLYKRIMPDLTGTGGDRMRGAGSAWEVNERLSRTDLANGQRAFQSNFDQWAESQGFTGVKKVLNHAELEQDFDRRVAIAMEHPHTADPDSPIQKMADWYRNEGYGKKLDEAKASGAEWAQKVERDDNYVPMIYRRKEVSQVVDRIGMDGLVDVVKQAFLRAQPDLYKRMDAAPGGAKARKAAEAARDAKVERLAKRFVDTVMATKVDGSAPPRLAALSGDSETAVREMLADAGAKADEVEEFLEAFGYKQKTGPNNFRRRAVMEREEPFIPSMFKDLPNARDYATSLRDLTRRSARDNYEDYATSINRHIALQKAGYRSEAELRTSISELTDFDKLKREGRLEPGLTKSALDEARVELTFQADKLMGKEIFPDMSMKAKLTVRIFKDLAFVRFMQQSGIANVGDLPVIALRYGVRNLVKTARMRDFFDVFKRGGTEADELFREVQSSLGVGFRTSDRRMFVTHEDMNVDGELFDADSTTKFLARVQAKTATLSNLTANIGGMNPVTDFLQTMSARAISQKFVDIATGRAKVSQQWLNEFGLDERTLADIRMVAGKMDLTNDGVIRRWNSDKQRKLSPEQAEAYDRFLGIVRREVNKTVLEPSPNALRKRFAGPIAGLLMQFKSYMFNALAVNTVGGLKLGPTYIAKALLVSSLWGSMIYAGQQYLNSFGRDDREEFLKERLSLDGIMAGGFQRGAFSSVFPMIIDTVLAGASIPAGEDLRVFSNARSSGLGSDPLTGSPVYKNVTDLKKLAEGMAAAAMRTDQEMDQTEYRQFRDLTPFLRMMGLLQATNALLAFAPADTDGAVVRQAR